ncbi:disease resistance protein RPV1-like [Rhodamnia argentea]|uniref:Disease resistance protein RPV1-like n=1 Tax=Rhodamnia argentea TaxID=178133 RepID=A0ABM3HXW9_9MYRT|nr:disease resistance protein RPV1-like [Rhodamnia argentea]
MKRFLSMLVPNVLQSNKKSKLRKADDTSASGSSAASAGDDNYDVFLSFRGEDTRKTFVDHLYNGLVNAGIRVFKDDNELREGEKISTNLLQAIKNSKISIPILSQNYASSKWCLQELFEMTECMKRGGHVVLPIFYQVEPAHVRYQIESFGKTFSHLSRKYTIEDVAKWKQALQEVASLKGWESEKTANGLEGQLVKMVVSKVLNELKKAFQLIVTEQLVGINNAVDDILRLLDDKTDATQIVGIYGMGGIGKTTLAKAVYNKLSNQFQYRSFIADIRESSQRNGISGLQNQLIFDILRLNNEVSTIDEGIRIMESRFKYKKVLLLLDDVDHNDQLKALVGKRDWFEKGSKVIITTRIKSVLDKAGANSEYELEEINEDESLILFSRHAFLRDSPPCEFVSLSRAVVSTTGGLPLALEVIGSFLYGRRRAFWEDALKRLRKVPHEKVQEKLRISYEALNYEEKQIFLDVACFGARGSLRLIFYMWEACNFLPNMVIETLSFMSLIKIGDNGELRMHDQLRDLGREIVREEACHAPINQSRLWVHEEALEVLERNKGIQKDRVQALCLNEDLSQREFTTEQFETLPNLRLLVVNNAKLIGNSKSLLPKLRWLVWTRCPASLPTCFDLEKLVILALPGSDISELWEGWSHLKPAKQLKHLGLTYCCSLKVTPDLSTFRNLEILTLEKCFNLEQIHPSIGEAKGLVVLDLRECKKLQELPQEMGKLEQLKELSIGQTAIEEIPPCIGSLNKLEVLYAGGCESLVGLPDSIGHLVNLLTLDLTYCTRLCKLPESIGSLVKLQHLLLSGVGICELPESIGDLKNLKTLNISHNEKLSSLPSTISKLGNLEELNATQCKSLGGEIPIDGLSSLKILRLSSTGFSSFPDTFDKLSSLEGLDLYNCKMLQSLPQSVSKLPCLRYLNLTSCDNLQSLPDFPASLSVLEVTWQHRTLPQLSHLIHLKKLAVVDCQLLESMPDLPSGLSELHVQDCGELKELSSLSSLEFLSELGLGGCNELTEIKGLEALKSLAKLNVSGCSKLSNLDGLGHLESLRYVCISTFCDSDDLFQVRGLDKLKYVEELRVRDCQSLVRPDLSQLTHLRQLGFYNCHNLVEIKGLEGLKNLEGVELQGCTSIDLSWCQKLGAVKAFLRDSFSVFEAAIELTQFMKEYKTLQSLPQSISKLPSLQHLDLMLCDNLQSLPEISPCLTSLKFTCQHQPLPQLSHLIHLKKLKVVGCRLLESLPELPSGLFKLCVQYYDELKGLPSLSSMEFLSELNFNSCSELTEIKVAKIGEYNQLSFSSLDQKQARSIKIPRRINCIRMLEVVQPRQP